MEGNLYFKSTDCDVSRVYKMLAQLYLAQCLVK